MPRRLARAIMLIVPCASALASGSADSSRNPGLHPSERLETERAIECRLGSEEHRHGLTLAPGQRAEVSVRQQGIDVVVRVIAPDGVVLGVFDDEMRDGFEEHVEFVAAARGIYTLAVKS